MVSVESNVFLPASLTESRDEQDAGLLKKTEMMRGSFSGPSVLARRLNRKSTQETEGTSTTDTDGCSTELSEGSRHESDGLSDASLECNVVPAIEFGRTSEAGADTFDHMPATACPFDVMPATACPFDMIQSVPVRPAFCEQDVQPERFAPQMQTMPPQAPQPMVMPPMPPMPTQAPQSMGPQAMQAMQQEWHRMQAMQQHMAAQAAPQVPMSSSAANPSPGPIMVPVPVPMPMPFSMPQMAPQNVPVPKGFKLVRIPEQAPEKKTAPAKSAISDPTNTDCKIFVGGLNPITTGQALREYFQSFGAVLDAKVIREGEKSKGFGFVQFKGSIPEEVLEQAHIIDQRRCGVGPAFHRESSQ